MSKGYEIRRARATDLPTLVAFTLQEALDSAGLRLSKDAVERGVRAGLDGSARASYWVAECPKGVVVGSASVVTEWSNFHGQHYWWIQSLFLVSEHRGRGLVDSLLDYLAHAAEDAGARDLRLYAEQSNERALAAYRRCGFAVAPYTIMTRQLTRR